MTVPRRLRSDRRVLVVGGGIAGLATLGALAQRGITAQLLDRATGPPDTGLAINLPGNAVAALRALGVGDALTACGVPVRRREYRNARGRLFFAVDEVAFWGSRNASRCVLRRDLITLLQSPGAAAPVRWNTEVRAVRTAGDEVEVSLADSSSDRYDFVVGADGVHSAVRSAILGEHSPRPSLLSGSSWRFMTSNPGVDCWCAWSGPDGTLLLIPLQDDQVYGYASASGRGAVSSDPAWLSNTFGHYPAPVRQAVSSALRAPATLYHSPVHEVRAPEVASRPRCPDRGRGPRHRPGVGPGRRPGRRRRSRPRRAARHPGRLGRGRL